MSTSNQAILDFLAENSVAEPRKLQIAIVLAESMVYEMRIVLKDWETTLNALQVRRRETDIGIN